MCLKERNAFNFSHVSVKTHLNLVFGMVASEIIALHKFNVYVRTNTKVFCKKVKHITLYPLRQKVVL